MDAAHHQYVGNRISDSARVHMGNSYNVVIAQPPSKEAEVVQSLRYPSMDQRWQRIEDKEEGTLQWLIPRASSPGLISTDTAFPDWLLGHSRLPFWISGKAGSGKSTMMKDIFYDRELKNHLSNWAPGQEVIVAAYFFYSQGSDVLQRSREGLLRSLLYQILSKRQDLVFEVFPNRKLSDQCASDDSDPWTWDEMKEGLAKVLLRDDIFICLLVDGLDELDYYDYRDYHDDDDDEDEEESEDQTRSRYKSRAYEEISKYFLRLAKNANAKICISSRPQKFEQALKQCPKISLQDHNARDIFNFVSENLQTKLEILEPHHESGDRARKIISDISANANGVFLWVVLIVRLIKDALDNGQLKTLIEVQNKVKYVPGKLGGRRGLYMQLLQDIPKNYQGEASALIRTVQHAFNPISVATLSLGGDHLGLLSTSTVVDAKFERLEHRQENYQIRWMEDRLKKVCVGLLEVHERVNRPSQNHPEEAGPNKYVGFLHLTAVEFLTQPYAVDTLVNFSPRSDDPNLGLLRLMVLSLKRLCDPVPAHDVYSPQIDKIWLYVLDAMHFAKAAEQVVSQHGEIEALLDEMDRIMTYLFCKRVDRECHVLQQEGVDDYYPRGYTHWSMTEPQESGGRDGEGKDTFISFAISGDLTGYLARKNHEVRLEIKNKPGRPLLDYAIAPYGNQSVFRYTDLYDGLGMLQASPELVEMLLRNGADPNQTYQSPYGRHLRAMDSEDNDVVLFNRASPRQSLYEVKDSPWVHMLEGQSPTNSAGSRIDRAEHLRRWAENAILLLNNEAAPADPHVRIIIFKKTKRKHYEPVFHTALCHVRERLADYPELQERVVEVLQEKGAPECEEHGRFNSGFTMLNLEQK